MAHTHARGAAAKLGEWVEARGSDTCRGRGLFAKKDIHHGQVVLVDSPFVVVQLGSTEDEFGVGSAANERSIRACTRCLAQIGAYDSALANVHAQNTHSTHPRTHAHRGTTREAARGQLLQW